MRKSERFWGHPDDWPDDEWAYFMKVTRSKKLRHRIERFFMGWTLSIKRESIQNSLGLADSRRCVCLPHDTYGIFAFWKDIGISHGKR